MGVKSGKQKLNFEKFDKDKITIVPLGDIHLGSSYCDEDLFKSHVDWILNNRNTYVILMGDNIESSTRDSVGAGVYEQDEIIDKQIEHFTDLVKPMAMEGRIIGMHIGNHEWRIYKSSGVDIARLMADKLDVKYFGWTVHHLFRIGKESYTAMSFHGHSGARLPHTKIKAVIDQSNMSDVEIYMMGHLHQLAHHTRTFYKIDKSRRSVTEGEKHFLLCGSYLNHWGSYAEQAGYEMMRKGSPKVKLSGLEHRIRVSL